MSISDVTTRFLKCLDQLIEAGMVKSKRQFAFAVGYHPQGISEMASGRRDVPMDVVERAVSVFHFNPVYLFCGNGPFFKSADEDGLKLHHLTVLTDQKGAERIVHVPCPAQAGYGKSLDNPVFIQQLPSYQLPAAQFNSGTYRSFEISGSSMEPTFHQGDIAVAAFIESRYWEQGVKNDQIHIVVTKEEVLIKRILNRIRTEKIIECISDNPEYEPYIIPAKDIMEIWKVRMKLTTHLDPPESGFTPGIAKQLMVQQKMLESLQEQFAKSAVA